MKLEVENEVTNENEDEVKNEVDVDNEVEVKNVEYKICPKLFDNLLRYKHLKWLRLVEIWSDRDYVFV